MKRIGHCQKSKKSATRYELRVLRSEENYNKPRESLFPSKFHQRLRVIKFLANDFDKIEALYYTHGFATDRAADVHASVRDVEKYIDYSTHSVGLDRPTKLPESWRHFFALVCKKGKKRKQICINIRGPLTTFFRALRPRWNQLEKAPKYNKTTFSL